jgi:uncharacterized membrane protein
MEAAMPFWDEMWWGPGWWFPMFPFGMMILCMIIMAVVMMYMMGMGPFRRKSQGSALDTSTNASPAAISTERNTKRSGGQS